MTTKAPRLERFVKHALRSWRLGRGLGIWTLIAGGIVPSVRADGKLPSCPQGSEDAIGR